MIILGIETSCDETAAAILKVEKGNFKLLSNVVSSQVALHAPFGGVVPNLAAREHTKNMTPVLESAFSEAKLQTSDIDLIAVTQGPGLIPALLVGVNAAKTLSYATKKPLLGIHHIEGHIYANLVSDNQKLKRIEFPLLCLVVSGGHTQLVLMKDHLNYKIIGETQDDAAGEAFDKVARILGLAYPGGPIISQKAKELEATKSSFNMSFPRPMINTPDFNFSFSGLKTAVLYETKKNPKLLKKEAYIKEVAHEFQQAVIDVLVKKTLAAAKKYKVKTIMLAGGVSANQELRKQLATSIKNNFSNIQYLIPDSQYCIDNAAMIAMAGYFRYKKNKADLKNNWKKIEAKANLKLC